MTDPGRLRKRLLEIRQEILARTGAVQRDLRTRRDPDSEERATQNENDPVLERLDESGRQEIARIDAALARVEAGTHDRCSRCGEPIGAERLEALPFATTCIECASSEGEATSSPS